MLQKFPAKRRLGEDENGDGVKKREEEEKVTETYLFFSHLIGLYKARKSKVKNIFDFGGEITQMSFHFSQASKLVR